MPESSTGSNDALAALAREALLEITREDTLGELREIVVEDEGTKTVRFENTLPGYPGWAWTVSVSDLEGEEPTVLETELLPGEGALLAPDWVPWVERLAEYEAAQEQVEQGDDTSDDDDEDLDDDDLDDEDLDDSDDDDADDDDLDDSDDDADDIDDSDDDVLDDDVLDDDEIDLDDAPSAPDSSAPRE